MTYPQTVIHLKTVSIFWGGGSSNYVPPPVTATSDSQVLQ